MVKAISGGKANDLFLEFEERWQAGPKDPERRAACEDDPLLFCRTYLPHHFDVPFSDFHKQDARTLRGRGRGQRVVRDRGPA
ncbi:MAG: hypothetical protein RIK87_04210 [Fuerstiella sp.]